MTSEAESRRSFSSRLASWGMGLGLASGYGMFASLMARFLYPAPQAKGAWLFVADLDSFAEGQARTFVSPAGQKVVISRIGNQGDVADFIALSSVCPHLGCQVHWMAVENRFFCPCHNGAFDPAGKPLSGPVKDANQSLPRYPLKVEAGLLYIEVRQESLV